MKELMGGAMVASGPFVLGEHLATPILLESSQTLAEAAVTLVGEEALGGLVREGGEPCGAVTSLGILARLLQALNNDDPECLWDAFASEIGEIAEPLPDGCSDTSSLREVCVSMVRGCATLIPVLRSSRLVGMVSALEVVRSLAEGGVEESAFPVSQEARVGDWMNRRIVRVDPESTLTSALGTMAEEGIRHLLVTRGDELLGILSNRDLIRAARASRNRVLELSLERCRVGRVMTPAPLRTTDPDSPLRVAADVMSKHGISALPVLESGKLAGIITTQDLLEAVACRAFDA